MRTIVLCLHRLISRFLRNFFDVFGSFFEAVDAYKEHPEKFSGRPGLPKYLKKERYAATFTSQVSKLSVRGGKEYLSFLKSGGLTLCIGREGCLSGRLIRTEAVYRDGVFRVNVTYECGYQQLRGRRWKPLSKSEDSDIASG